MRLIPLRQAAAIVGSSPAALSMMALRRQVPHYRLTPRVLRFDPEELHTWINQRRVRAVAPSQPDSINP